MRYNPTNPKPVDQMICMNEFLNTQHPSIADEVLILNGNVTNLFKVADVSERSCSGFGFLYGHCSAEKWTDACSRGD
jgi:hypothetical protein